MYKIIFVDIDSAGLEIVRLTDTIFGDSRLHSLQEQPLSFKKVLQHQNRSYSERERSKTVRFDGFCSKSTPKLQIRLISMISSTQCNHSHSDSPTCIFPSWRWIPASGYHFASGKMVLWTIEVSNCTVPQLTLALWRRAITLRWFVK